MAPPDHPILNQTRETSNEFRIEPLYLLYSDLRYMDCNNTHYEVRVAMNKVEEDKVLSVQLIRTVVCICDHKILKSCEKRHYHQTRQITIVQLSNTNPYDDLHQSEKIIVKDLTLLYKQ